MNTHDDIGLPRGGELIEIIEPKSTIYTDVKPIQNVDSGTLKFAPHSDLEIFMQLGSSQALISKVALAAILQELSKDCLSKFQPPVKDAGYCAFSLMENQLKRAYAKIEELNHEIMQLKENE
jgi:hypothetical protein